MITFLPYPDFEKSAKVLDRQRLGKQRLEAKQILEINLTVMTRDKYDCEIPDFIPEELQAKIWGKNLDRIPHENQPAVRMWRTYETYLAIYGMVICGEWISRGYKDNLFDFFDSIYQQGSIDEDCPPWLGLVKFHVSHQAKLLSKDYQHYHPYFGDFAQNLYPGVPLKHIPYEWNIEYWKEFSHD